MSTTFCSVCGFDTPHLGAGCLVCHEVAKNQEANRLDAMTLYDGAAIKADEIEDKMQKRIELLNIGLGRKYPGWSVVNDEVCGWVLASELASHAIPESIMLSGSPTDAFKWCERFIKYGVDGDDS